MCHLTSAEVTTDAIDAQRACNATTWSDGLVLVGIRGDLYIRHGHSELKQYRETEK